MYKNILLPIDLGDEHSAKLGTARAVELAQASGARMRLMTVVPDFGMSIVGAYFPSGYEKKALEDAKQKLRTFAEANVPGGIEVQCIVGHGTIYQEILRVSKETGCDLIVMASHRPGLGDYLLGPNAARAARHAGCSVLVVRD